MHEEPPEKTQACSSGTINAVSALICLRPLLNQWMMLREINSDRSEEHRRSTRNSRCARSDNKQTLLYGAFDFPGSDGWTLNLECFANELFFSGRSP